MINHASRFYTAPMNLILRKLFIKNYADVDNMDVRIRHGILASIIGIVLNSILIGLKLSSAIILAASSNWVFSMALIGDTINNTGDIASSIVSLIGFFSSKKPADKEHPFGHQRMEYIASLIVSIIIIFAAITLLEQSITHLVSHDYVQYTLLAYIVFGCSIFLKCVQAYIFYGFSKAISSPVLKGVALDSMLDVTSSSIMLISALISSATSSFWLDAVLGIAISCFVCFSGVKMAKESIDFLLGRRIDKQRVDAIKQALLEVEGVLGVHDLIIHQYGANLEHISVHIEVDASLSLQKAHAIAEKAEAKIDETFHQPVVIHVDPKQLDEETLHAEEEISEILKSHYATISIHDFQKDGDIIHFDVLMPYSVHQEENKADFAQILEKEYSSSYHYQINIDHPFDQE